MQHSTDRSQAQRVAAVHAAIADDDLQLALDLMDKLAESDRSPVEWANGIVLARQRLSHASAQARSGRSTAEQSRAERVAIASQILDLASRYAPARQPSKSELKARQRYLQAVREDLDRRREASLHHAVLHDAALIDIRLESAPAATRMPWHHVDIADPCQCYSGIDEAFDRHERRLLILGDPGAGKTVSLLHLAEQSLKAAEADPSAPVPLVVNLSGYRPTRQSGWRFGARGRRHGLGFSPESDALSGDRETEETAVAERDIERWLAERMAEYPGASVSQARRWLREERVAIFLDGLDEVDIALRNGSLTT